tara:strand:+ start:16838 stop:17008 length:171 start_codon:yes stop_codon:yes gene_type:complete
MSKRTQTHYYLNGKKVTRAKIFPSQEKPKMSLPDALSIFNAFMKNDCVTSKNRSYA